MAEYILNLLPLKDGERELFETVAPEAVHVYTDRNHVTEEQLANATIMFGWPVAEDLKRCGKLKWFQTMWAGADEYLAPGVLPKGVMLTTSSGSNSQAVAEHMLACLLALCRKLPQCRDAQLQRVWCDVERVKTISGATVLVLGAGHIGSAFARACRVLGAHTVGVKRSVTGPVDGFDEVYSVEHLDELLPLADVVALCMPHTPDTAGLMNERRLRSMKKESILLNAGRGSALDQAALVQLLHENHFWGAALDVMVPEPLPEDHPLWTAPNLLITPHIAGGVRLDSTRKNCIQMAADNLKRYLNGEPLNNLIKE